MNRVTAGVEHQHECSLHRHLCEDNVFGISRAF